MVLPNQHKLAEQCTTDSLQTIYSLFFFIYLVQQKMYTLKNIYTQLKKARSTAGQVALGAQWQWCCQGPGCCGWAGSQLPRAADNLHSESRDHRAAPQQMLL